MPEASIFVRQPIIARSRIICLLSDTGAANLTGMDAAESNQAMALTGGVLSLGAGAAVPPPTVTPTEACQAAPAAAQALARQTTAPATSRAYRADWAHFADCCAAHGFIPVPAAPAAVGAYLASLADSHAPTIIRRRLSALGKMHRFNDLTWNPAHRDIQGARCEAAAGRCRRPPP
jgi:hypothetical protein